MAWTNRPSKASIFSVAHAFGSSRKFEAHSAISTDRVFPFHDGNEAMAYVETGRAKGKVVVKVR